MFLLVCFVHLFQDAHWHRTIQTSFFAKYVILLNIFIWSRKIQHGYVIVKSIMLMSGLHVLIYVAMVLTLLRTARLTVMMVIIILVTGAVTCVLFKLVLDALIH